MSWQEELQQLDNALAAGQISADEYRQRRDQLLTMAAGQAPQQPVQPTQPPNQQQPQQQSGPPQTQQNWFSQQPPPGPPAPQQYPWERPSAQTTQHVRPVAPPPPDQAEQTQIVPVIGQPGGGKGTQPGERTQVVSGPTDGPERTQVVRPGGGGYTPTGQGQPGGWPPMPGQGQRNDFTPPWGASDLPLETPNWIRQGPEVFDSSDGGKTRRVILIVALVVLLLGGGATAYFLTVGSSQPQATQQNRPAAPTTTAPPAPKLPKGPFFLLPGKELLNTNWTMADAVAANVPTQHEAQLLQTNNIGQIGALITDNVGVHEGIWSFAPASGADASAAFDAMNKYYTQSGYQPMTGFPNGVHALTLAGNNEVSATFRAHYLTTTGVFVRVEVFGVTPTVSPAVLEQDFRTLVGQETAKFKPTTQ